MDVSLPCAQEHEPEHEHDSTQQLDVKEPTACFLGQLSLRLVFSASCLCVFVFVSLCLCLCVCVHVHMCIAKDNPQRVVYNKIVGNTTVHV